MSTTPTLPPFAAGDIILDHGGRAGRVVACEWDRDPRSPLTCNPDRTGEQAVPNVPEIQPDLRARLRRAVIDARVAADDCDTVAEDMLRPPRSRELGPALHAVNYRDARGKLTASLDYLLALLDGDESGPPVH
jgi:hypothetical protein